MGAEAECIPIGRARCPGTEVPREGDRKVEAQPLSEGRDRRARRSLAGSPKGGAGSETALGATLACE